MGCLTFKPGVRMTTLDVGGGLILAALARTALNLQFDLEVTSGSDGLHSGPADPHGFGKAFDVHSQSMSTAAKHSVLHIVMDYLGEFTAQLLRKAPGSVALERVGDAGFATPLFYGVLEDPQGDNEHFHFQVRKGTSIMPLLPRVEAKTV